MSCAIHSLRAGIPDVILYCKPSANSSPSKTSCVSFALAVGFGERIANEIEENGNVEGSGFPANMDSMPGCSSVVNRSRTEHNEPVTVNYSGPDVLGDDFLDFEMVDRKWA